MEQLFDTALKVRHMVKHSVRNRLQGLVSLARSLKETIKISYEQNVEADFRSLLNELIIKKRVHLLSYQHIQDVDFERQGLLFFV